MPTEKHLRAVLVNFLGTYTSRYSEYRGYWLFGFLVEQQGGVCIDLLSTAEGLEPGPAGLAHQLAIAKFHDQLRKGGFTSAHLHTARLTIEPHPHAIEEAVGGHLRSGKSVRFRADLVSHRGRHAVAEQT